MVGIDICYIKRFKRLKEKYINKVLSDKEYIIYKDIKNKKRRLEYLASRFCIKEAYFKASNNYFRLNEISVLNDSYNRPYIENKNVNISISHDKGYVISICII